MYSHVTIDRRTFEIQITQKQRQYIYFLLSKFVLYSRLSTFARSVVDCGIIYRNNSMNFYSIAAVHRCYDTILGS